MRTYAEANKVAMFRKLRNTAANKLEKKIYTGGYPYSQNGLLLRSSVEHPIYSYAKNFKKFGKEFCLFVWTTESDEDKVLESFDKHIKNIKRKQIMEVLNNVRSFAYL